MSKITAQDWRVVEAFLDGRVTLMALDEEGVCSNGTRVLVAQAIVLGISQEYIASYEGMLLKTSITDLFRELFPGTWSGRLINMSRSRGLHRGVAWGGQRTANVEIIPADGMEELLDRYKTKNRLAPARASLAERRKANEEAKIKATQAQDTTAQYTSEALVTAGRIADDLRQQYPPLVLRSIAYALLSEEK